MSFPPPQTILYYRQLFQIVLELETHHNLAIDFILDHHELSAFTRSESKLVALRGSPVSFENREGQDEPPPATRSRTRSDDMHLCKQTHYV